MHTRSHGHHPIVGVTWNPSRIALSLFTLLFLIFIFLLLTLTVQSAQGQTFQVIHDFTGGTDGAVPYGGLVVDTTGNLYGTASSGGYYGGICEELGGCGVVFKLTRTSSGWEFSTIHTFQGMPDRNPFAPVTIGPGGSLYGSASSECGTIYSLRQPVNATGPWAETILYSFSPSGADGCGPNNLIFDQAGNIYSTTSGGGGNGCSAELGCGTVFMLTHSGGDWQESILHIFSGLDGAFPSGVLLDQSGNLYGTTGDGGPHGDGIVYELMQSQSDWREIILDNFVLGNPLGAYPSAGLMSDAVGNLYGVTKVSGGNNAGTAFMLTPSGGGWQFDLLYTFDRNLIGANPSGPLTMDTAGSLYGATQYGVGEGFGAIYKLTHSSEGWTATSLHQFTGDDGHYPFGAVTVDADGNIYGTTFFGGQYGFGVVWEITP